MGVSRNILEQVVNSNPLPHLRDPRPEVRRLAAVACAVLGEPALEPLTKLAGTDPDDEVRADVIELLSGFGDAAFDTVWAATGDPSQRVVESAVTALGEIGAASCLPWLIETVAGHDARAVREAAVAALGAIGDDRALPTLLEAARAAKPQVRRRAVVALTAFEGSEVEAALMAARLDRNPMVREVAEMVLGRASPGLGNGNPSGC